jgi:hypothetical protein
MDIDWPLAIELLLVFVAFSVVRYAYFKRRMRHLKKRDSMKQNGTPD